MKMPDPTYTVDAWVNPRGNVARDYVRVAKNASWLSHLCSLWLSYYGGDDERAKYEVPYRLPGSFPDAKRINEAIKNCGLWGPTSRKSEAGTPEPATVTPWPWVYEQWKSGSLDRQINDLLYWMPEQNRKAVRKEMLK